MSKIIAYIHHGRKVFVDVLLKGKHRYHCLCWKCGNFKPSQRDNNCNTANILYGLCKAFNIVTPVWECPNFVEGDPAALQLESTFSGAKEDQETKHAS